ncbi:MAG: hypothetical protein WC455_12870 [Dehalococcoidia bacterium]|jgi:hypothetical protein
MAEFDIEKARAFEGCQEYEHCKAGEIVEAACDEIERLQATRSQELADAVDGERDRWLYDYQQQAKRIQELGAALIEPAKSMLTVEQREALGEAISMIEDPCEDRYRGEDRVLAILQNMLSGSLIAWEATEERKTVLENCISGYGPGENALREYDANVLRAMLTEAKP